MKRIRAFLASSNDMKKFREIANRIIDEINCSIGEHFDFSIQLFRWENNTIPAMGRPQEVIFDQSNFDNIDIFIGIIGTRFGTATGGFDSDNQEYESGTSEEYSRAYSNFINNGKPHIMIFNYKTRINPDDLDIEQYKKVQNFLSQFETSNKTPGLYHSFKNVNEFQRDFRISVIKCVLNVALKKAKTNIASEVDLSEYYKSIGFQKLFISETNDQRSEAKRKSISNSSRVFLLGKTGNSFLGSIGNRYLDLLTRNAKGNSKIRILLLNPWTISAISTAFTESGDFKVLQSILQYEMASQELIEMYRKTRWYTYKLMDVIQNYSNIKRINPQIELRFTDADVSAAVLITDDSLYFEPYYNYCHNNRLTKITSTFELVVSNYHQLYNDSLETFDFLWKNSISYNDLIKDEIKQIVRLSNYIDALAINNTLFWVGVHALIKKENRFLILHRTKTKTYMSNKWDIPGGSMQAGETVEQTVVREVAEETGLIIKPGNIIFAYSNFEELPNRQTLQIIVEAKCISDSENVNLNPKEHDDSLWVTVNEAKKLPLINFLEKFIQID